MGLMTPKRLFFEAACLCALAILLPLPLYLLSLALFGLPHVVWELAYLARRYAGRWTWRRWLPLGFFLVLQLAGRSAVWLGLAPPELGQLTDLIALGGLILCLVLAPSALHGVGRLAAALLLALLFKLMLDGEWLFSLLLLALAHNFTPLGFALDLAREDPRHRTLYKHMSLCFALPVVLALSGLNLHLPLDFDAGQRAQLTLQIPAAWRLHLNESALMSAVVLAQCLHYAAVLRWLPATISTASSTPVIGPRLRWIIMLCVLALLCYYLRDYSAARQFYGLAAGLHAWLEWPILLMLLCGPRLTPPHPSSLAL